MKITETTKPVERTFTIEFTKNQLMNLGLALGTIIPNEMKRIIDDDSWEREPFPGIVFEDTTTLYTKIIDIIKTNK